MIAKSADAPFPIGAPSFANGQKFFMASAHFQAKAFKSAVRFQIEMLDFLKRRIERDVRFVDDLAESDEFNDAFDIVGNFMQNAMADYTVEVGKIATIGSRLALDSASRARKQAEEVVDDLTAGTLA